MVTLSAPARANSSTCLSGRSIMRCTSMAAPASWTRSAIAPTIKAPKVIGGTKWPSITSTWMIRAPASSTSFTWDPRRAKSADRIEGATWRSAKMPDREGWECTRLDRLQHAALAVVAGDARGARHAHDRGMFAAVRTHRDQLVTLQTPETAIATGQGRGPQPRLAAARARWTGLKLSVGHGPTSVKIASPGSLYPPAPPSWSRAPNSPGPPEPRALGAP